MLMRKLNDAEPVNKWDVVKLLKVWPGLAASSENQ